MIVFLHVISPSTLFALTTAPSSPPAFLSVVATGPYSLNISWVQPPIIHHNSPLTGYKITYNMEGENEMEFDTPDADMLYYILDDLYSFMPYEVKVAALNDAGIGPFTTTEVAYTDKTREHTVVYVSAIHVSYSVYVSMLLTLKTTMLLLCCVACLSFFQSHNLPYAIVLLLPYSSTSC